MYKLLLVFCFVFFCSFKSNTNNSIKTTSIKQIHQSLKTDSSKVDTRSFNATVLDQYLKDPHFNYKTETPVAGISWWDRFWLWFWHLITKLFGGGKPSNVSFPLFAKYLLLALAIGMLIYIVIKIIGFDNIFNKESKLIEIPYYESLENIHAITFDEEIEKAIANRNYKLAVRLLYLRSLKQLSDAQLINWQMEKTNSAYLNELTNSGQRQSFSVLTRQFEYVWYGDFHVDGASFQNINALFQDFKKMLP